LPLAVPKTQRRNSHFASHFGVAQWRSGSRDTIRSIL
jgi:hypothetical protein